MAETVNINSEERFSYESVTDLANLDEVTLKKVLECLIARFKLGHYYTFAGSVLISLNPCLKSRTSILNDIAAINENAPHVYSVGLKCIHNVEKSGRHQVVIVSGESGAGKTTATQQLLRYFIENQCNSELQGRVSGLEKKVYYASQILEAFGNASTTANANSSRFGRLIQIHYGDGNNASILGASIETCLMEKHRVAKWAEEERNFHVFYCVLEAVRARHDVFNLNLKDLENLTDLIPSSLSSSLRPSDSEELNLFLNAVQALQMEQEMNETFRIIFGLSVLLGFQFVSVFEDKENASDASDQPSPVGFSMKKRLFKVKCTQNCKTVIESVFKIDFEDLEDVLVARNFSAGRRKSCIRKPCETVAECSERLSALIVSLYDSLFAFILNQLNKKLDLLQENVNKNSGSISLLDLYGFESLQVNHLEQMCINYANERLQQVYVGCLKQQLKMQMDQDAANMSYVNNLEVDRIELDVISRIEKIQRSLFLTLDETCVLNRRQTDEEQVFQRLQQNLQTSDVFRFSKRRGDHQFLIRHYAGEVTYKFQGMVEKNRDYVPPELIDLLRNRSCDSTLKAILQTDSTDSPIIKRGGKAKREKTVLQRFKASVEVLMGRLMGDKDSQDSVDKDIHFIRCIRPNYSLQRGKIVGDLVEKQLYSCGIVDAIRITANGLPIRLSPSRLEDKFPAVFCRHSLASLQQGSLANDMKICKTLVFMSESAWTFLIKLNDFMINRAARLIQDCWRKELKRREQEEEAKNQALKGLSIAPATGLNVSLRQSYKGDLGNLSLTLIETTFLRRFSMFVPDIDIVRNVKAAEFCHQLMTRESRDIFSKRHVFQEPVRVYVKKTVLHGNHNLPRRFLPQGIQDAFDGDTDTDTPQEFAPYDFITEAPASSRCAIM